MKQISEMHLESEKGAGYGHSHKKTCITFLFIYVDTDCSFLFRMAEAGNGYYLHNHFVSRVFGIISTGLSVKNGSFSFIV